MLNSVLSLAALAAAAFAAVMPLSARAPAIYDFGAGRTFCTCPPQKASKPQALKEVDVYLPGARNYAQSCSYASGSACAYDAAGKAVNPPKTCAAKSSAFVAAPASQYCFVTCPATLGTQTLDTTQSNVVIVAAGSRSGVSYVTCRYSGGGVCQFDPQSGALSQASRSQNNGCADTNTATTGCCYSLATSST